MFLPTFFHLYYLGREYQYLQGRVALRQGLARAAGTQRNHRSAVAEFLAFCLRMQLQPYHLCYQDVCAYVEYLASHAGSPSTIKNKLSSVRVHMGLLEVSRGPFLHPRVNRAIDAIEREKSRAPRPKQPLPPMEFKSVLHAIPTDYLGNVLRASLLVLYYGALRQSELLPRTVRLWSSSVQPTRSDCHLSLNQCSIHINYAKNLQRYDQSRNAVMEVASDPALCPVRALHVVLRNSPCQAPTDPIFVFSDGQPVPSSFVLKQLHIIMRRCGYHDLISQTSLHSIRKAAATNAHDQGCSQLSIQNYGAWQSDAYRSYIRTKNMAVNRSLIQSLHNC